MELRRGEPDDLPLIYRLERRYMEEVENNQLANWYDGVEHLLDQWVASLPQASWRHRGGASYLFA